MPDGGMTGSGSLRIGLAGYGTFAQFLEEAWSSVEGVRIVAAATLHEHPKHLRVYEHWDGLLSDPEIDLVAITTPPNLHAPVAEAMMEAGKHVIIEKPVATTLADADRLLEVRDRTGRVAAVDFMMRFTPIVETIASWKHEQPFGRLRRAVIENHAQDEKMDATHWFWDPTQSGGILVEHAVHFFDVIESFTSAHPVRVDACSHYRSVGKQDRMLATVCYDDGLMVTQYHTFSRPQFFERTTMRLWFDLAEVELEGWFPMSGSIRALTNAATEPALAMFPHLTEVSRCAVPGRDGVLPKHIEVSGEPFLVADEIRATFAIQQSKSEIYAAAVRAVLSDVCQAIADPTHQLRVPLEAGAKALRLAIEATHRNAFDSSRAMEKQEGEGRTKVEEV